MQEKFQPIKSEEKSYFEQMKKLGIDVNIIRERLENSIEILVNYYMRMSLEKEPLPLKDFITSVEKKIIDSALLITLGNQKEASKILKIKYTSLNEKMKRLNIHKKQKQYSIGLLNINN